MSEITVAARKFLRLFDYLERIGLDVEAISAMVDLSPARIAGLDPDQALPAQHYSRLYKVAAEEMQRLKHPFPWAAGLGSESFALMCHCVIAGRTLGEALDLAQRFDRLLYPLNGYRMELVDEAGESLVHLRYIIEVAQEGAVLIPEDWDRASYRETVARASGLLVWHAFCGWLIGQAIEARELRIAAPFLNREYQERLEAVFRCPVEFGAEENAFSFDRETLSRRLVHNAESLKKFLGSSVYHLIASERGPASTSAAIKSLVSIDLPNGMPSFSDVAAMLYMSESSLRRRLQGEQTSYQAIKDEVRCEVAIDKLLHENARVADLAELLGFTEASSFVRSFKSWTGHTPKSYRDRMQALGHV